MRTTSIQPLESDEARSEKSLQRSLFFKRHAILIHEGKSKTEFEVGGEGA